MKLIELESPKYMVINEIYYKGQKKREFLKNKKQLLSQIPQNIILGFGYVIEEINLHDGESMDDIAHSDHIMEYVFMRSLLKDDDTVFVEKISELVFRGKNSYDNLELANYINELRRLGYIKLPLGFMWQKSSEDMVEELSFVKSKK